MDERNLECRLRWTRPIRSWRIWCDGSTRGRSVHLAYWQWLGEVEQQVRAALLADGVDPTDLDRNLLVSHLEMTKEALEQIRDEGHSAREAGASLAPRYIQAIQKLDVPTHIHLCDVQVRSASDISVSLVVSNWYWRGRLAQVSGWTLGGLELPGS